VRIGELAGPRPEVLRPVQQGSLGQALEGRPELELTGLALEFDRQGFVRRCCQWEQARAWGQEVPPIRAIWESQASGLLASAEGLLASGLLASAEGLLASVQELLALAEELQQEQMGLAPVSVHRGFGKRHCQWERAKELRVHSAIQAIFGLSTAGGGAGCVSTTGGGAGWVS